MKHLFATILLSFVLVSCSCQKKINSTALNPKLEPPKGKEVIFVKLINDSRCPEGTQCLWAGEVTFEVVAYENGEVVAQKQFTLNPNNQGEVVAWFKNHLPENKQILKEVAILPYPKDGVSVKVEDYYYKLIF